jgi:tetratricopeptide (TPR) repeat protein
VVLETRALIYSKMDKDDQALSDYNAALQLDGGRAISLYGRGLIKLKEGDTNNGQNDVESAKHLDALVADKFRKWGVVGSGSEAR